MAKEDYIIPEKKVIPVEEWQALSDADLEQLYSDETGFSMNEGHGSDIALLDFARAVNRASRKKNHG